MTTSPKSRYAFGQAQNWLDDEPASSPAAPEDREALLRKIQEGAESVGYVAPSEHSNAIPAVIKAVEEAFAPKAKKVVRDKPAPEPEPDAKKGRPKGDRTIQMSVRIRQEHDELIKAIARDDFSVASIVDAALTAFAKGLYQDKKYKRMPLDEETLALAKAVFSLQSK